MTPTSARFFRAAVLSLLVVSAIWSAPLGAARFSQAADSASLCNISTNERVVAVGDVHGGFDRYVAILREAKIIDGRRRWAGGRAHFVQVGDAVDRGDDSRKVLDLLRELERDAARAGGRVHYLLGNHEIMVMLGDLRYVSAGDYAAFQRGDSADLRDRLYGVVVETARNDAKAAGQSFDERAYRDQFLKDVPLGRIELQRAYLPEGDYGKWLRQHNVVVRINGVLYLHGGVSPIVAPRGCEGIAAAAQAELAPAGPQAASPDATLLTSPDGPLWYRGLADGSLGEPEIAPILQGVGARAIVVGHTVTEDGRIQTRFGGRVVTIDTGLLGGAFYPKGQPSALEISGGQMTAIYLGGKREPLGPVPAPATTGR